MKYTITYKQNIGSGKRTRQITKIITVYRNKKPTTEQILDLVREDSGGNFDRDSIKMTYWLLPAALRTHSVAHLEAEIADMQKEIDRQKQKAVTAEERLERTKNWLGIID